MKKEKQLIKDTFSNWGYMELESAADDPDDPWFLSLLG